MIVVKVFLWPGGYQEGERLISQATIALEGIDESAPDRQRRVRAERWYRVRLLKGVAFGGPKDGANLSREPRSKVWREGLVFGHSPGGKGAAARGEWDLIGGALKVLLGERLGTYRGEGSSG